MSNTHDPRTGIHPDTGLIRADWIIDADQLSAWMTVLEPDVADEWTPRDCADMTETSCGMCGRDTSTTIKQIVEETIAWGAEDNPDADADTAFAAAVAEYGLNHDSYCSDACNRADADVL